jgi:serine protease Do
MGNRPVEAHMAKFTFRINRKHLIRLGLVLILLANSHAIPRAWAGNRENAIVRAVRNVGPAVVNISLEYEIRKRINPFSEFSSPLIEEFFKDFFDPGFERRFKRNSLGSGVILEGGHGYILTNAHVVAKTGSVTIVLNDEREYKAQIVGTDPESDLAVLKIDSNDPLPGIPMGNSDDLMIGETVIAIGNPFGFSNTVTTGVISAVNRSFRADNRTYYDFIQTDASINPGNSGGPLINADGDLIGINTAIYAGAQGIGFAIPIQRAKRIVSDLIVHGEVVQPWIGLTVQDLDPSLARYFSVSQATGVLVARVEPDSPASRAGIREGGVVMAIDGHPVTSVENYHARMRDISTGDRLELGLITDGHERQIVLQSTPFPMDRADDLALHLLGIEVGNLKDHGHRFPPDHLQAESGVVVTQVREGSSLQRTGVRPGDIIRQVENLPVTDQEAFRRAIVKYRYRPSVLLLLQRGHQRYYLTVTLYES